MINLLSDVKKAEIRAGRVNIIILRYIAMTAVAAGFVTVVVVGSYLSLFVSKANAQNKVNQDTKLATAYASSQTEAATFRNNLTVAKQILAKEITYSALLLKIAHAVPSGVILDQLTLDSITQTQVGKPFTIQARAHDNKAAIALKSSFEKETDLFTDVHFQQIIVEEDDAEYPISITIEVTLNKKALQ